MYLESLLSLKTNFKNTFPDSICQSIWSQLNLTFADADVDRRLNLFWAENYMVCIKLFLRTGLILNQRNHSAFAKLEFRPKWSFRNTCLLYTS